MASLLSPTQIRDHIETDLTDTALQRIIDGEEQAIVEAFGPHITADETIQVSAMEASLGVTGEAFPYGATSWIYPSRPIATITSITETVGSVDTILATSDYKIHDGRSIERLQTGTNPRAGWGHRVRLVYVPVDTSALRIRVLIDLVRLALAHTGMQSQSFGDFGGSAITDYQGERNRILNALARVMIV
jgi:hypothetical protein